MICTGGRVLDVDSGGLGAVIIETGGSGDLQQIFPRLLAVAAEGGVQGCIQGRLLLRTHLPSPAHAVFKLVLAAGKT